MTMKNSSGRRRVRRVKRSHAPPLPSNSDSTDQEYRVGPGRPPREYQFKPGQSGNPNGARRKPKSIVPDLKALLERALSAKVTLRQGEKERIITKARAGIEQLVNQFAKGDPRARHDLLIALAAKLGIDLLAGQGEQGIAAAASANDQALLDDYVRRRAVELYRAGEIDLGSRPRVQLLRRPSGLARNPTKRTDR
jgi:Family of unknown function (DUF5681)